MSPISFDTCGNAGCEETSEEADSDIPRVFIFGRSVSTPRLNGERLQIDWRERLEATYRRIIGL